MTDLSPQDVGEFKALVKKQTGKDITDEEARTQAMNLIRLVTLIVKPIPPLSA